VTCADVRFTWQAQTSAELGWAGATLKRRIASVDCPDERTAVFRFTAAYADQLVDANDNAVVPRAYGTVALAGWKSFAWPEHMVTCGPFRLVSVSPGQEAVLERDPLWWGAADVPLDRVVFRVQPQAVAAFERLLEGELHVLPKVPPLRASELTGGSAPRLVDLPSLSFTYVGWNVLDPAAYLADRKSRGCVSSGPCSESVADIERLRRERPHPILADPRVRRALTLGIDRRDLIDGLWGGHARVGGTPIVSCLWAHDPASLLPFDPEGARSLLDDAGWRDEDRDGIRERGGKPLEIRVIVNAENQTRRDALDRAAASLARVGVRLIPEPLPRGDFGERARD
jgi:peptide/nickel transport system substrate-binding protein